MQYGSNGSFKTAWKGGRFLNSKKRRSSAVCRNVTRNKADNLQKNDEAPDGSFFFRTALHLP